MLRSLVIRAAFATLTPFGAAIGQPSATVVYLVRHAEKAAEPAADPPLTTGGEVRAEALSALLADKRIDAIIVTPTTRTRTTAAPTAKRFGIAPEEISPRGGAVVHAAAVAERIRTGLAGRRVLVVGHSNTIPAIIKALGGPTLPDLCDAQYSNLFAIDLWSAGEPTFARMTYGAADALDAGSCIPVAK